MIRLLLYSHFFAPSVGGVETVVSDLARGLAETRGDAGAPRFHVTIVTRNASDTTNDATLGCHVVRRPSAWQLWRMVRDSDVIHVAGPALSPMLLALLAGKPVVVEHHGFQVICPTGQLVQEPQSAPCPGHFMAGNHRACLRCQPKPRPGTSLRLWLSTFLRRSLCRRVDCNITPTSWLGTILDLPHTTTIAHGVPAQDAVPSPPAQPVRFIFVGRLVDTKGLRLLLEAARQLHQEGREFDLRIIGDGPERGALETLVVQSGLSSRIRFNGKLSDDALASAWQQADALIAPSLGGEVFGMTPLEAMSRGLPVIASDLGSFAEVLGDTGMLFRTGDAKSLADKMAALLDNSSLRSRLGEAARQRALQRFSISNMVDDHARIYQRLSHESAGR
jgi:glycosyltransferase involved in cell wall biosynthesis